MAEAAARRIERGDRAKFRLTSLALDLAGSLLAAGYDLVPEVRFGRYCVDFYEPTRHLAFEADSDYWHGLPGRRKYDEERDIYLLSEHGLPVVRFTEYEIMRLAA